MREFLRQLAKKWVKAQEEGFRTHMAVTRLLARVRAGSLLDVGCASGQKALLYASTLGLTADKIVGIEPQEYYATQARQKFRVHNIDIEKEPFPLPDESLDLVICNQVLEHLKNIFMPLSEMDRVVKRGGWLLIGVPNMASLYSRALLLFGQQPISSAIDGPHVRSFAHDSLLGFLRQNCNFEVVAVDSSNLYPLPYPLLNLLGGHFPGLSCFTFYLLKKVKHKQEGCGWKSEAGVDTLF